MKALSLVKRSKECVKQDLAKKGVNPVIFPALRAEMARRGLKTADVAKALGISHKAAYNRISGVTGFMWSEALVVRNKYFPGMTLHELYQPK